jgi:hypothetical protein
MLVFARAIEHPLNVTVQSPHDADAREHRWPSERPRPGSRLPSPPAIPRRVLGLRQLGDVGTGVLEREELATARAAGSVSSKGLVSSRDEAPRGAAQVTCVHAGIVDCQVKARSLTRLRVRPGMMGLAAQNGLAKE